MLTVFGDLGREQVSGQGAGRGLDDRGVALRRIDGSGPAALVYCLGTVSPWAGSIWVASATAVDHSAGAYPSVPWPCPRRCPGDGTRITAPVRSLAASRSLEDPRWPPRPSPRPTPSTWPVAGWSRPTSWSWMTRRVLGHPLEPRTPPPRPSTTRPSRPPSPASSRPGGCRRWSGRGPSTTSRTACGRGGRSWRGSSRASRASPSGMRWARWTGPS